MNATAPIPVERYQRGGDIFGILRDGYGTADANFIAQAAATKDRKRLTDAIAYVREKHGYRGPWHTPQ